MRAQDDHVTTFSSVLRSATARMRVRPLAWRPRAIARGVLPFCASGIASTADAVPSAPDERTLLADVPCVFAASKHVQPLTMPPRPGRTGPGHDPATSIRRRAGRIAARRRTEYRDPLRAVQAPSGSRERHV
jgi:hypothetical protein